MGSLPLVLITLLIHLISHQVHANDPQIFVTTALVNFDARIVQAWSGGGGDRWTITNDSNYPFAGREFGAADRWTLKGTQTFGSGYPYGNVDNSTIAGRPFPYGLWPLYWGNNITGSDEYGPALDGIRPGGQLVTIPLKTEDGTFNITEGEMYHIIGDRDSATFMMISLVTSCHVTPAWPSKFDPTSPNSTVKMENVVHYYRASSFALASPGYNNTFAHGNTNTESTESTPITDNMLYSEFHKCLDDVILNALPIMNWPPEPSNTLGDTMGIVFGILGIPILVGIGWVAIGIYALISDYRRNSRNRKIYAQQDREAQLAARKEALKYEQFP